MVDVLRKGPGDDLEVFDGSGQVAAARITSVDRKTVYVSLSMPRRVPPPAVSIHLYQALPKTGKMEWIIQKATELGARRIVPVRTAHAVPRWSGDQAARKVDRWRSVAREAARQCGSAWIPEIAAVADLADAVGAAGVPGVMLLADLRPQARPLKEVLAEFRSSPPAAVGLVVGPEGDFSAAETDLMTSAGWIPVRLGRRVLRTETAALYIVGACAYEFE